MPSESIDSESWPASTSHSDPLPSSDTPTHTSALFASPSPAAVPEKIARTREIVLVAAIGQEPRLGRWIRLKEGVKNGALVVHLQLDNEGQAMMR